MWTLKFLYWVEIVGCLAVFGLSMAAVVWGEPSGVPLNNVIGFVNWTLAGKLWLDLRRLP